MNINIIWLNYLCILFYLTMIKSRTLYICKCLHIEVIRLNKTLVPELVLSLCCDVGKLHSPLPIKWCIDVLFPPMPFAVPFKLNMSVPFRLESHLSTLCWELTVEWIAPSDFPFLCLVIWNFQQNSLKPWSESILCSYAYLTLIYQLYYYLGEWNLSRKWRLNRN